MLNMASIVNSSLGIRGSNAKLAFIQPNINIIGINVISVDFKDNIIYFEFVCIAFFIQQFGAFLGISVYTWLALTMGRRPAFAIFFVLAFGVVSYTFLFADTIWEAYFLALPGGFVTLGPFGGYAIYFPELFPTRLRATGTGFCYNVGRFLAALVTSSKGGLQGMFMGGVMTLPFLPSAVGDAERAIRYGSFLMIFIYLVGLIVLLFAPETKGKPLPED